MSETTRPLLCTVIETAAAMVAGAAGDGLALTDRVVAEIAAKIIWGDNVSTDPKLFELLVTTTLPSAKFFLMYGGWDISPEANKPQ